MQRARTVAIAGVVFLFASTGVARAETKVELKGTHLCCGQCVKAANEILKGVDGATGKVDQKAKTITITAKDDETAQKAIDALAAGGVPGETDNKNGTGQEEAVPQGQAQTP